MGADNSKRSWDLAVVLGVNVIKHGWRLHGCREEEELWFWKKGSLLEAANNVATEIQKKDLISQQV